MTEPARAPHVLYLAGSGRSGSTIVARYLESELDAVHVGELRYLWDRGVVENQLCECGQPFGSCPFWTEVLAGACPDGVESARAEMARLTPLVDRLRRMPGDAAVAKGWGWWPGHAGATADVAAYADVLAPVYEQIQRLSGAALVIDSSKDPSYLYALQATGRIDLTVLHLVRDSRAVAYSWTRRKVRPEIHWEEQEMRTVRPARSAKNWMQVNLSIEAFARLWPGVIRERYEDFAADPARCRDQITAVLPSTLVARRSDIEHSSQRHSFSGNPIRFDTGPIRVTVDSSWTTAMTVQDRRTVSLISAPLLLAYRYPLS